MTSRTNLKKAALSFLVLAFVFGTLFGVSHFGMGTKMMGGQMGPCPLMPGVAICNMTPLQHIAAAQTMFNTLPQQNNILLLLLMLLASIITAAVLSRSFLSPPKTVLPRFVPRQEYVSFSPLQEAFSNGILHSKVF